MDSAKSAAEHDAKSLHDSVAATLRMFKEDDEKKAKKLEADAWERAYRAKVQHASQAILIKRAKKTK